MLKPKYFFIYKPALSVTAVKYIFFCKHKLIYIKTMSSQASLPASPASIMEEISTRIMSDVVKNFNIQEFIDYLKRKDLKLNKNDIKILRKEKISSHSFFKLTEEKLK